MRLHTVTPSVPRTGYPGLAANLAASFSSPPPPPLTNAKPKDLIIGGGIAMTLSIFGFGSTTNHGGLGVNGLVTWPAEAACSSAAGELGVTGSKIAAAIPLPEGLLLADARGIVVGWRRTVALLLLVVADE